MKLIFCSQCYDVVKLHFDRRKCLCGKVWGYYKSDGLNAVISTNAIPLGFANSSLVEALKSRPKTGWGKRFEAFIIPEQCDTVEVEKEA